MRRIIQGIPFIIHSPSTYVLDAYDDGSDIAWSALRFDGSWWVLTVTFKAGHTVQREFTSFAHAIALLSSRRAAG